MPTDTIKKVGFTNTPTLMDYSTLQSWEDACPADITSTDERWIGECYDQGEFTSATTLLAIAGTTVDATRYIILRCATGASFSEKAGVRTTALFYNASNGVAARVTANYIGVINNVIPYTQIRGLQFKCGNGSRVYDDTLGTVGYNIVLDKLLCQNTDQLTINVAQGVATNCLFVRNGGNNICFNSGRNGATGGTIVGCTLVNIGAAGTSKGLAFDNYGSATVRDNAVFGFNTFIQYTGSSASSSNNATDLASGFGANNQTSLTFASQFQDSTNDFRAIGTGSLDLNGTPDATNIPADITGTTRHATTPTIGAWEVAAVSSSLFFLLDPAISGNFDDFVS